MIEEAELNIYLEDGGFVETDLSAMQLETIFKALGLEVQREGDVTTIRIWDDETLKKMKGRTIDNLIPVENLTPEEIRRLREEAIHTQISKLKKTLNDIKNEEINEEIKKMKILFKVLKLYKKEGNFYPCKVEFGTCSACKLQLNETQKAYMLDGGDPELLCGKCFRRSDGHGHKRTSPASKTG